MIRFFFLQTLLCLIFSNFSMAQYHIQDSILIKTKDGAEISALAVRKKGNDGKLPALLTFTVYARQSDLKKAMECADKGYVGVVAYTRGKRYSLSTFVPYEYDGEDANQVIDWITKQSWSNQQVGMYGGSYSGFTQWAATKKMHPALKTIVPSASAAPGLDVPMTNNVFMSFTFPWTYYVSNNQFLDEVDYNNNNFWNAVSEKWFQQGNAYTQLDSIAERPENKIFRTWLAHPAYDRYWQDMIPYPKEFSKINIPVLTTTGYYDGGQISALYYLRQHYKYHPQANHYLLIGPYGHFGSQGYPTSVYNGYQLDPVANVPIHDIIYQWFDYILKGGTKPAILKDKINYQVMGSNQWKHASSLAKMGNDSLTFYLSNQATNSAYLLDKAQPKTNGFVTQTIDFKDRSDTHSYYWARNINYDTLYHNGQLYMSEPLKESIELNGAFTGKITASINKKDMDYSVALFELTPEGKYFYLSYFMGRASYAASPSVRKLLIPNKKTALPFSNTYLTSKKLSKGSRIVIIVNINKNSSEQVNYGSGKEVNEETIADAGIPLQIKWFTDSFIKIPIWRE
jgi:putative CocE/NonD family hydrolase